MDIFMSFQIDFAQKISITVVAFEPGSPIVTFLVLRKILQPFEVFSTVTALESTDFWHVCPNMLCLMPLKDTVQQKAFATIRTLVNFTSVFLSV